MKRRAFLLSGAALLAVSMPARATPMEVAALIATLTADAMVTEGGMKLDLPLLVENGNVVAMTVSVDDLPPGLHVESLHVFAEANPVPNVLNLRFGPASARLRIATRIRLATSQTVIALAKLSDGSFRRDSVDLLVTLAACLD
jgi:sulfur-oxidizing protein SoxY